MENYEAMSDEELKRKKREYEEKVKELNAKIGDAKIPIEERLEYMKEGFEIRLKEGWVVKEYLRRHSPEKLPDFLEELYEYLTDQLMRIRLAEKVLGQGDKPWKPKTPLP